MNAARCLSVGLELELPAVDATDGAGFDARGALLHLHAARSRHDPHTVKLEDGNGQPVAVASPWGLSSFDNGFNNLETAFDPVFGDTGALVRLSGRVQAELQELAQALQRVGAGIVNLAEHPLTQLTSAHYARMRAPRCIYEYWVGRRGWDHAVGMDAKAQNGPTSGLEVEHAVEALNLILLAAPAFIALHANSPFESGRAMGVKENRLLMWRRMFARAHFAADRRLCELPTGPFADLGEYFRWMFGTDTAMHAIHLEGADYKSAEGLAEVDGHPSLLAFLAGGVARARCLASAAVRPIVPSLRHLEQLQFAHFLDARIRFGLGELPPVEDFLAALERPAGVEALFRRACTHCYIEGRAAGNNLADAELLDLAGESVAASAVMGPSALQKGLLNAPGAWRRLSRTLPWRKLAGLREAAIQDGMDGCYDGIAISTLCDQVLELAHEGLSSEERPLLDHPVFVLESGLSGADRALRFVSAHAGSMDERLRALVARRRMVIAT